MTSTTGAQIIRFTSSNHQPTLALANNDTISALLPAEMQLHDLLAMRSTDLRSYLAALPPNHNPLPTLSSLSILAPIDGATEVWAAGVTYTRSMDARREESATPDIYSKVYSAQRPELFFKATPRRVSGPGQPVVIRADSTWDVPEPELALVINRYAEIVGYTIANDMSSRSIEGENPLYLPQAKVYAGCCALGPAITMAWDLLDPYALTMHLSIERAGHIHWQGQTSTGELKRRLDELTRYLFLQDEFPSGAILCTGTALVPDPPFTLQHGDIAEITIDTLGTLRNPVIKGKIPSW
jgi:2-dehydro-3-deoxy-D-arabinonate dehydratase